MSTTSSSTLRRYHKAIRIGCKLVLQRSGLLHPFPSTPTLRNGKSSGIKQDLFFRSLYFFIVTYSFLLMHILWWVQFLFTFIFLLILASFHLESSWLSSKGSRAVWVDRGDRRDLPLHLDHLHQECKGVETAWEAGGWEDGLEENLRRQFGLV